MGAGLRLGIAAERYALAVRSPLDDDPALRFSDNHFDRGGGEESIVTVTRRRRRRGMPHPEAIQVSSWNGRS